MGLQKKMAGADPTFLKAMSHLGIAQHGVEKITVYRVPLQDLLIDAAPCDTRVLVCHMAASRARILMES